MEARLAIIGDHLEVAFRLWRHKILDLRIMPG
jgi:hypothetical protein